MCSCCAEAKKRIVLRTNRNVTVRPLGRISTRKIARSIHEAARDKARAIAKTANKRGAPGKIIPLQGRHHPRNTWARLSRYAGGSSESGPRLPQEKNGGTRLRRPRSPRDIESGKAISRHHCGRAKDPGPGRARQRPRPAGRDSGPSLLHARRIARR